MSCGKKMVVGKGLRSSTGDLLRNSLRQKPHVKRLIVSGQQKAKPAALITDDYGVLNSAADTFTPSITTKLALCRLWIKLILLLFSSW